MKSVQHRMKTTYTSPITDPCGTPQLRMMVLFNCKKNVHRTTSIEQYPIQSNTRSRGNYNECYAITFRVISRNVWPKYMFDLYTCLNYKYTCCFVFTILSSTIDDSTKTIIKDLLPSIGIYQDLFQLAYPLFQEFKDECNSGSMSHMSYYINSTMSYFNSTMSNYIDSTMSYYHHHHHPLVWKRRFLRR